MIHEWRSYRLKPGAAGTYLALLADQGLPLVTRHLPLVGYWLAETGGLNVIHHLWAYADWTEREACRAGLATEEGWTKSFVPDAFALVEEQENRFLRLDLSSSAYDTAIATRRRTHAARQPGDALFASQCAGLIVGDPAGTADAVACWTPLSGDPRPVTLLPRRDDPVPATAPAAAQHSVLRPLAFSPL